MFRRWDLSLRNNKHAKLCTLDSEEQDKLSPVTCLGEVSMCLCQSLREQFSGHAINGYRP